MGRSTGGQEIVLTRRTIAFLEDAGWDVGEDLVGGVVEGSFPPRARPAAAGISGLRAARVLRVKESAL